jgi:hypothetical protein
MMDNAHGTPSGVMNIMDDSGHRQLHWDMANAKDIAAAQKTFDRLVKQGYAAFGATGPGEAKRTITAFDPTMDEVVMVPRIVGG